MMRNRPRVVVDKRLAPLTPDRPVCVHCRKRVANRRRGLCWSCYNTSGIREQYPPLGRWGEYGAMGWAMHKGELVALLFEGR